MTEQQIADQLFDRAQGTAARAGRHFGDGADFELRQMTHNAAFQIMGITEPEAQAAEIRRVSGELDRLINMALENVQMLTDYPTDLLGELTFFPAKMRFCPCPPLC